MFLDRVRTAYPHLTESQKRLADYLVSNYRDAAFMTASKLANAVDLNEATVVRFAQRLDYPGYPALIDDIRDMLQHDLGADSGDQYEPGTPLERISERITQIAHQLVHVGPAQLDLAAQWIRQAGSIYVIGHGAGAGLGFALAQELTRIGRPAMALSADLISLRQLLLHLGKATLLIIVSTGSETADLSMLAGRARNAGTYTLAVARHPLLESAQAAEMCLSLPPSGPDSGTELSTVAALIDALVAACEQPLP